MISLESFIHGIQSAMVGVSIALMKKNEQLIDQFFEDSEEDRALQSALDNVLAAIKKITSTDKPEKSDYQNALKSIKAARKILSPKAAHRVLSQEKNKDLSPEEERLFKLLLQAQRRIRKLLDDLQEDDATTSAFSSEANNALLAVREALYQEDDPDEAKLPETESRSLRPRSVVVEYPRKTEDGVEQVEVHIPLITLVPLSMSQVKEAKIKLDFDLILNKEEQEIQLSFPSPGRRRGARKEGGSGSTGNLEVRIEVLDPSEGLRTVVEGYGRTLRAQMPH